VPFLEVALMKVSGALIQSNNHNEEWYRMLVALVRFVHNISNLGFLRIEFLRTTLEELIDTANKVLTACPNEALFERYGQSIVFEIVRLLDKGTRIIRSLQVVQTLCTYYWRYSECAEELT